MLLSRDRSLAGHECGGIRARPSARPSFGSSAALLLTERARSAAEAPLSCANLDSGVVNRLIGPGKRIYLANTRSDPGRPVAHRRVTPLLCPVAGYSPTPLVSGRFPFRPHPRDDFFDKSGFLLRRISACTSHWTRWLCRPRRGSGPAPVCTHNVCLLGCCSE